MEPFTTYDKNATYTFPMSDFCGSSFDNEAALGKRYTLLYVQSGSGLLRLGERTLPYIAPCVLCVGENERAVISDSDDNRIRAIYFHPKIVNSMLDFDSVRTMGDGEPLTLYQDRELLRLFIDREGGYVGKFNLSPLSEKKFTSLFDAYHELICGQNADNWPCRSRSYLLWLLFLLENLFSVGDYANDEIPSAADSKLHPILEYLYHNYDRKLTVTDITERFFISKTTLSKLFREELDGTFLTYLNKLRITMASVMLRDTLLPVNEIENRVGFTDSVHFFRTFRKYTGYTPTGYRESFNRMDEFPYK